MELREFVDACMGGDGNGVSHPQDKGRPDEAFLESLEAFFRSRRVEITPLLGLRTADVLASWRTVRHLERESLSQGRQDKTNGNGGESHDADPKKRATGAPSFELTAKAWDRLRKAMKDLEEMLPSAESASKIMGLPELMRPLLKKADGVLEDALAYEAKKKRARANSHGQE